jgi:hypothetical protein
MSIKRGSPKNFKTNNANYFELICSKNSFLGQSNKMKNLYFECPSCLKKKQAGYSQNVLDNLIFKITIGRLNSKRLT